ncbi:hypothetical protein AB0425_07980 [Actinosynnema sp. NPDC051121]
MQQATKRWFSGVPPPAPGANPRRVRLHVIPLPGFGAVKGVFRQLAEDWQSWRER